MTKVLFLMAIVLANLTSIHAHAATIKMPKTVLTQLKIATEQRQKGECEQKKLELLSADFYALNNGNLLILIGLPDYFCHASSFMPVTVDKSGHWKVGTVIESYPSLLVSDAQQQLWLVSHFEHEAVFPVLHHSIDGVHWQEINLPKSRHIDCCFEWIKAICITESQLQLKFTGIDNARVEYWQTPISDSLKTTPNWQKMAAQQCQMTALTSGDWQRKPATNGTEILFHSATAQVTVSIPKWLP